MSGCCSFSSQVRLKPASGAVKISVRGPRTPHPRTRHRTLHLHRHRASHQIQRSRELPAIERDCGRAPEPRVLAFLVQDRVLVVEAVERLREGEGDTWRRPTAPAFAPPGRRLRPGARLPAPAPTDRPLPRRPPRSDVTRSPETAAITAASSRPCRSFNLLKMLLARTAAYCR